MERIRGSVTAPSGLLLAGGTSARMGGVPKALLTVGGKTLARRAADALLEVADPVLALGLDASLDIPGVADPQRGPLRALEAGVQKLRELGVSGYALLLGCDLPFVSPELLRLLARHAQGRDAAVPRLDGGIAQPVSACYSTGILPALELSTSGSMRELLGRLDVNYVPANTWRTVAPAHALFDVDTPQDLATAERLAAPRAS